MDRLIFADVFWFTAVFFCCHCSPTKVKLPSKQYAFRHAAVAADNEECSKAGKHILKKGGSAVDAAIATTLCVGVINMHSTGIGGGGFMMVYDSHKRSAEMIDFRETAPEKSGVDLFKGDPMNGIRGKVACCGCASARTMTQNH